MLKNLNKEWSDTKSAYETIKAIKKILKVQMKVDEMLNVVDKKGKRMGLDEKFVFGVRTTGKCEKNDVKVELFVKIIASVQL